MKRALFGIVVATVLLVGFGASSTVYAHDDRPLAATASQAAQSADEARTLTEELRAAAATRSPQPAIQAAYEGKAERRRTLLNQLAKTNPARVLDLALTQADRDALSPRLQQLVEQHTTIDGELQVVHHDYEDGHGEYDIRLAKDGRRTPLRFGASIGQARPGDDIRINGVALSGVDTVVSDEVVVINASSAVGPTDIQRTAILLVNQPGTKATIHPYANKVATATAFFSDRNPASAYNFYYDASYHQTRIVGMDGEIGTDKDVIGPLNLDTTACNGDGDHDALARDAMEAAVREKGADFTKYSRVVLSINNTACTIRSSGTVRPRRWTLFGIVGQYYSVSWVYNMNLIDTKITDRVAGTALHEYGHNLGVWHANALECGAVAIGSGVCSSGEYGDPADVMGVSRGFGDLNAVHKDILGWLTAQQARTITTSGTYTINRYENRFADSLTNLRVLRLPRTRNAAGTVTGFYYLEYRKPLAYWDDFLTVDTSKATADRPDYANGVLVHTSGSMPYCTEYCGPDFSGSGGGGDSNLIDTQPGSRSSGDDFADAPLTAGQSYTDVAAGVAIRVISTTPTTATIQVTLTAPRLSVRTTVYPQGGGFVTGAGESFTSGQTVTLRATPAAGFCFLNWKESRSDTISTNPLTFQISADRSLEAVFKAFDGDCSATVAPPPNANFPGPTIGTGQYIVRTPLTGDQTGEPNTLTCDGRSVFSYRTVWYTYVAPASGAYVTLNTLGSDFDTVVAVYTGSAVGSLTPVVCNNDGNLPPTSSLKFNARPGTVYRIQVGGLNGAAGIAVLNMTVAPTVVLASQQQGPVVISGNLAPGGRAFFDVPIRNTGDAPTAAIRPYVEGVGPNNQPWRADGAQPAVIQPSQTVTFRLQLDLPTAGTWRATGVHVIGDAASSESAEPLPANGQDQQFTFQVGGQGGVACTPRPPIAVQTTPSGDGRLKVTLTVGSASSGNRLASVKLGADGQAAAQTNALLDLPGVGNSVQPGGPAIAIPGQPTTYTFYLRRRTSGQVVTLPLIVTDQCGPWQTVVGGGSAAQF